METVTPEILSPLEALSSGSLIVRAETKITVNDFGDDFKKKADIALESMKNSLETDDDFLRAEKDVNACKETEDKIKAAWDELTKGDKEIAEVKTTIDRYLALFSASRLALSKAVTKRDKEKKEEITSAGVKKVADAVAVSPAKNHFQANNKAIIDSIFRKSKYAVMEKCVAAIVETELKRLADLEAVYLTNTTAIDAAKIDYPALFPDREALSIQPVDIIKLTIDSRITAHKLAEKERIEREEKAEAARKAKEAEEKRIADEKAESDRIAARMATAISEARKEEVQQDSAWQPPSLNQTEPLLKPAWVAPAPTFPPPAFPNQFAHQGSVFLRVEVEAGKEQQVMDAIGRFPSVLNVSKI